MGSPRLRLGEELFGSEGVAAALADADGSAQEVIEAVEAAITASGGRQLDDIAILALVAGTPPEA